MRKKILLWVAVIMGLAGALAIASWWTSMVHVRYRVEGGRAIVVMVKDAKGQPVGRGRVTVRVVGTRPLPAGLFEGYTGPGSIVTDEDGRVELSVPSEGWTDSTTDWALFWCIPIRGRAPLPRRVRIEVSAEGYRPESFTAEHGFRKGTVTLTLRDKQGG